MIAFLTVVYIIKCDVLVLNKLKEMATSLHDTGLGEVDRAEICKNYWN